MALSPEEQLESEGKVPALNFIAAAGVDVCITTDPDSDIPPGNFQTSLRADGVVRGEILTQLRAHGIKPESIHWSNGAFKEFQIHRASCEAIARDILWAMKHRMYPHLMQARTSEDPNRFKTLLQAIAENRRADNVPTSANNRDEIFDTGEDAYDYLTQCRDMNIFLGGAPGNGSDLALPFTLTHSTPILRHINDLGRRLVNELFLKGIGKLDTRFDIRKLPIEVDYLLYSRAGEMGRAKRLNKKTLNTLSYLSSWSLTLSLLQSAVGDMRVVTLADNSGRVVLADRMSPAKDLQAIYGEEIAIAVETHAERTHTSLADMPGSDEPESVDVKDKDQHGELKRFGVFQALEEIADNSRKPESEQTTNNTGRYVVIDNLDTYSTNPTLTRRYRPL